MLLVFETRGIIRWGL